MSMLARSRVIQNNCFKLAGGEVSKIHVYQQLLLGPTYARRLSQQVDALYTFLLMDTPARPWNKNPISSIGSVQTDPVPPQKSENACKQAIRGSAPPT
jgi:hypothetical protein